MSPNVNKAISLIEETNDEISNLIDQISDHFETEDDPERAHKIYEIALYLNVFASALSGEKKVYEGSIIVDNVRSLTYQKIFCDIKRSKIISVFFSSNAI